MIVALLFQYKLLAWHRGSVDNNCRLVIAIQAVYLAWWRIKSLNEVSFKRQRSAVQSYCVARWLRGLVSNQIPRNWRYSVNDCVAECISFLNDVKAFTISYFSF